MPGTVTPVKSTSFPSMSVWGWPEAGLKRFSMIISSENGQLRFYGPDKRTVVLIFRIYYYS
jgi:hypothetical protein